MDLSEIKSLIEAQGTAFEEFKKTNDALIKAKAEGKAVTDIEAKLAKIDSDMATFSERKAELDAALPSPIARPAMPRRRRHQPRGQGVQRRSVVATATPQVSTFRRTSTSPTRARSCNFFAQGQARSAVDAERKAMLAGDDSNGGYSCRRRPSAAWSRRCTSSRRSARSPRCSRSRPIALEGMYDNDEGVVRWVESRHRVRTRTPRRRQVPHRGVRDVRQPEGHANAARRCRCQHRGLARGQGRGQVRPRRRLGVHQRVRAWSADLVASPRVHAGRPRPMARVPGGDREGQVRPNGDFAASNPADKLFDLIQAFKDRVSAERAVGDDGAK
jgi:hypothetical protein